MRDKFAFSQSVMHVTKIPNTAGRAGIVVSARSLMLVLACCAFAMFVATPARSQTSPVIEGPHRLPHVSPITPLAEPAADGAGAKDLAGLHYKFITIGPESSPYAVAGGINNAGRSPVITTTGILSLMDLFGTTANSRRWTIPAPSTGLGGVNNHGVVIGSYNDGTADHVVTYDVRSGAWARFPTSQVTP